MDWLRLLLGHMAAALSGKPAARRSPRWPAARAAHLKRYPECAACGTTKGLEVHHLVPVHVDPRQELAGDNLMTFCERHHFSIGHLENWTSWNAEAVADAAVWKRKLAARP